MERHAKRFTIRNRLGLHARAATLLVQVANRFPCEIRVRKGRQEVNAKSIMGVLQLAAARGQVVEIAAEGEQCQEAVDAVGELIRDGFGEEE
ncbi:MAG: HPr family phosphocarrier protein [Myxococcales bacterium]|nr:HPr family phosphocarrier protein [Myxococcales bacterium]